MKQLFQYIKTSQRFFAFLFLFMFPLHTVFIYSERFINGYKWEYGTLAYYGIELLGWAFIVSMLIPMAQRAKQATCNITTDRIFLMAMLAFLIYSFASTLWAVDSNLAQQQTTLMLLMFLIFLTLPMVLTKQEIVFALSLGALVPIGVGLYQFFSQSLLNSTLLGMSGRAVEESGVSVVQFGEQRWLRAYGTFSHPNVFGGYLAALIVSMVYMLRQHPQTWSRLWYMVMLLLSGVLLILTMSRSAWLGVILGVGAIVFVGWEQLSVDRRSTLGKGIVTLGIGMLFALIIAWPLVSTRISGGTAYEIRSVQERVGLQQEASAQFMRSPIVGVGAGNITAALIEADSSKFGYAYQPVHNVFMLLLVEYGIVGVLLLAVVCYYFIRFVLGVHGSATVFAPLLLFLPLMLFDHYLWTGVHGLGIGAVFLAILLSSNRSSTPKVTPMSVDE